MDTKDTISGQFFDMHFEAAYRTRMVPHVLLVSPDLFEAMSKEQMLTGTDTKMWGMVRVLLDQTLPSANAVMCDPNLRIMSTRTFDMRPSAGPNKHAVSVDGRIECKHCGIPLSACEYHR